MPAIHERYAEELRDEFDYLSTWLPNSHLELGDVGRLHRDRFERLTSLSALGISFDVRDRERSVDLEYNSAATVGVSAAAETGIAPATVRISVSFSQEHGIVFQAKSCTVTEVANRAALGDRVLELVHLGRWPAGQVVVTEVVRTGPAVVLIAQGRGAHLELTTDGPVPDLLPLASVSAALEVVTAKDIGVKVIAPEGLTPLFRASGVRRRLFGGERFGNRGQAPATEAGADDLVFAELGYEDVGA